MCLFICLLVVCFCCAFPFSVRISIGMNEIEIENVVISQLNILKWDNKASNCPFSSLDLPHEFMESQDQNGRIEFIEWIVVRVM